MNKLFLHTSRIFLSTFETFCPAGVQIALTVVHFAHFQIQARKRESKGWLGVAWGCFVYISPKGVCDC